MELSIVDYSEFINSINDYIIITYGIIPRSFEFQTRTLYNSAVKYKYDGSLVAYDCPKFNKQSRIHCHPCEFIFCSEPEVIAVDFIYRTVFSIERYTLIKTLKLWLPTVAQLYIKFNIVNNIIITDLFPSFFGDYFYDLNNSLKTKDSNLANRHIQYYFISVDNIEENNKLCVCFVDEQLLFNRNKDSAGICPVHTEVLRFEEKVLINNELKSTTTNSIVEIKQEVDIVENNKNQSVDCENQDQTNSEIQNKNHLDFVLIDNYIVSNSKTNFSVHIKMARGKGRPRRRSRSRSRSRSPSPKPRRTRNRRRRSRSRSSY